MGMNVGGGDPHGAKSDINVTPLIDVVLVLLIIFLVTMPIQMRQITVEIPRKADKRVEFDPKAGEQITVELAADGRVLLRIGGSEEPDLSLADLPGKLRPAIKKKTGDKTVFVDFDYEVKYDNAVTLMDMVRAAGAEKVALVDKSAKQSAAP
ncbi:MAG: protein TolR [Deltaproteobacteria bacterium]|nr:MAG: protein TolR [Deltaproteobacteria bacterium]